MSRYTQILSSYDTIHQSRLNRASHAIGIPLIMTSVIAATSYVGLGAPGALAYVNLATVLAAFTVAVVLSWSAAAGLAYLALVVVCYAAAKELTTHLEGGWAALAIAAAFAFGWVFQFVGHGFEGKSPQFVKRPENLLLGPVMIMAELIPPLRAAGLRGASVARCSDRG